MVRRRRGEGVLLQRDEHRHRVHTAVSCAVQRAVRVSSEVQVRGTQRGGGPTGQARAADREGLPRAGHLLLEELLRVPPEAVQAAESQLSRRVPEERQLLDNHQAEGGAHLQARDDLGEVDAGRPGRRHHRQQHSQRVAGLPTGEGPPHLSRRRQARGSRSVGLLRRATAQNHCQRADDAGGVPKLTDRHPPRRLRPQARARDTGGLRGLGRPRVREGASGLPLLRQRHQQTQRRAESAAARAAAELQLHLEHQGISRRPCVDLLLLVLAARPHRHRREQRQLPVRRAVRHQADILGRHAGHRSTDGHALRRHAQALCTRGPQERHQEHQAVHAGRELHHRHAVADVADGNVAGHRASHGQL